MNEPLYKNSAAHAVLSRLGWLYLLLAGKTARINIAGNDQHPGPVIYALWHEQQAMMTYINRGHGICTMVSRSRDGEYMARILRHFGYNCARGSSTRGGATALRSMIKAAGQGYSLVVTPDGPRGPAKRVQRGILYLAQKTGLPIVPCGCFVFPKITFSSWDNYQFPLPLATVNAVYGTPMQVAAEDDLERKGFDLEYFLNTATNDARFFSPDEDPL
jgi:lysophospholipid acyltransferase (LPLAT)-like uncharacterized protein